MASKPNAFECVGLVLDEEGKPVPDCRVCIRLLPSAEPDQNDPVPEPLGETRTDSDGRYRFSLAMLRDWSGLALSSVTLQAAADRGRRWSEWDTGETRYERGVGLFARIDLHLASQRTFFGRVVDEKGRPVANAEVAIRAIGNDTTIMMETDPSGAFDCDEEDQAGPFEVLAQHPSYGRSKIYRPQIGGACEDIVLRPFGHSVRGKVQFFDGTPAVGVQVEVEEANDDEAEETEEVVIQQLLDRHQGATPTTDARGEFACHFMRKGQYRAFLVSNSSLQLDDELDVEHCKTLSATAAVDAPPVLLTIPYPRLTIEVVDEHGRSMRDARLSLAVWRPADASQARSVLAGGGELPSPLLDRTQVHYQDDPMGARRAIIVPGGALCRIEVQKYGANSEVSLWEMPRTGAEHRLRLVLRRQDPARLGRLEVRLLDRHGQPILPFSWHARHGGRFGGSVPRDPESRRKGWPQSVDGLLGDLPAGPIILEFRSLPKSSAGGRPAFFLPQHRFVQVMAGQTTKVSLSPHPGARLRLRLRCPTCRGPRPIITRYHCTLTPVGARRAMVHQLDEVRAGGTTHRAAQVTLQPAGEYYWLSRDIAPGPYVLHLRGTKLRPIERAVQLAEGVNTIELDVEAK